MAATEGILQSLVSQNAVDFQRGILWTAALLVVATTWAIITFRRRPAYPSIDETTFSLPFASKINYLQNARQILLDGLKKYGGNPFTVNKDGGRYIVVPPSMTDYVNASHDLSFPAYVNEFFLSRYETFDSFPVGNDGILYEAVKKAVTRSLPKFTKTLNRAMTDVLDESWNSNGEGWHNVNARKHVLEWIATMSTRVFLPEQFSRDKEFMRISIDFTVAMFTGAAICRLFPWPLTWVAERLLPICRKCRRDFAEASRQLKPVLDARRAEIAAAEREGRAPELPDDAIEWMRQAAGAQGGKRYREDAILMQLTMASIHTTSDLLLQALLNLAAHPEYLQPLREEATTVLKQHSLSRTAFNELDLLDSFFKETQRQKPIAMTSMNRVALADVVFPNGFKIRKGELLTISDHSSWQDEQFDPWRYSNFRQTPGKDRNTRLVDTSTDHLAFAHGKHACPGRFFAANEVKVAMLHVILKYDIKLKDASMVKWKDYSENPVANPDAIVSIRGRQPEIDIDALASEA